MEMISARLKPRILPRQAVLPHKAQLKGFPILSFLVVWKSKIKTLSQAWALQLPILKANVCLPATGSIKGQGGPLPVGIRMTNKFPRENIWALALLLAQTAN